MQSWRISFETWLLCLSFTAVFGSSSLLTSSKVRDHRLQRTTCSPPSQGIGHNGVISTQLSKDDNQDSIHNQAYAAGLYHHHKLDLDNAYSKRFRKRAWSQRNVDQNVRELEDQTRRMRAEYKKDKKTRFNMDLPGNTFTRLNEENSSSFLYLLQRTVNTRKVQVQWAAKDLDREGRSHDAARLRFSLKGYQNAMGRKRGLAVAWLKNLEEFKATGWQPEHRQRQGGRSKSPKPGGSGRSTPEELRSDYEGSPMSRNSLFSELSHSPVVPQDKQGVEGTSSLPIRHLTSPHRQNPRDYYNKGSSPEAGR